MSTAISSVKTKFAFAPEAIRLASAHGELVFVLQRHPLRRRLAVRVQGDGSFILFCPAALSLRRLRLLLQEKSAWLIALREKERDKTVTGPLEYHLATGTRLPYLGGQRVLRLEAGTFRPRVVLDDLEIRVQVCPEARGELADLLRHWYRRQARELLPSRLAGLATLTGRRRPTGIQIRDQKTRWGSCSAAGGISLNFRLIMLDWELIDYVLIHELAHLYEMNHSLRFWNRVEALVPDWRSRRQRLKQLPPLPL